MFMRNPVIMLCKRILLLMIWMCGVMGSPNSPKGSQNPALVHSPSGSSLGGDSTASSEHCDERGAVCKEQCKGEICDLGCTAFACDMLDDLSLIINPNKTGEGSGWKGSLLIKTGTFDEIESKVKGALQKGGLANALEYLVPCPADLEFEKLVKHLNATIDRRLNHATKLNALREKVSSYQDKSGLVEYLLGKENENTLLSQVIKIVFHQLDLYDSTRADIQKVEAQIKQNKSKMQELQQGSGSSKLHEQTQLTVKEAQLQQIKVKLEKSYKNIISIIATYAVSRQFKAQLADLNIKVGYELAKNDHDAIPIDLRYDATSPERNAALMKKLFPPHLDHLPLP